MSANLLAELDDYYRQDTSSTPGVPRAEPSAVVNPSAASSQGLANASPWSHDPTRPQDADATFDDDDFGDFETAPPAAAEPWVVDVVSPGEERDAFDALSGQTPFAPAYSDKPRPKPFRASSSDILQGHLGRHVPSELAPPQQVRKPRDENVLFDAEDDSADEFGDYHEARIPVEPERQLEVRLHTVEPRKEIKLPRRTKPAPNLLDLDSDPPSEGLALTPTEAAFMMPEARTQVQVSPSTAQDGRQVSLSEEDTFEAWEPIDAPVEPRRADTTSLDILESNLAATAIRDAPADGPPLDLPALLRADQPPGSVPPTNIPPPAVLLPVFPKVLGSIQVQLLDRLPHDPKERTRALNHPTTVRHLQDVVTIATACAHVIAGRKNRWKRDTILAQSMRIGQASGKNGMKLTGLDKSEHTKEEREATDVVRAWKIQLGRLRSCIASTDGLKLPDISEHMPVRLATQNEGAVSSPKPCVLCGLKRNERIPKVDVDVQDSFGEWWMEHLGHRSCVAVWETYKSQLAGR